MLAEPALLSWISGKLGDQVYLNVHGQLHIRDKGICVQPNTGEQAVRQANLATISQAWSLVLSEDDRQSWIRKASSIVITSRSGKRVHHSGYLLFVSRAVNLSLIGAPLPMQAPEDGAQVRVYTLELDTIAPVSLNVRCLITSADLSAGFPILLLQASPQSLAGVTYFSNLYRSLDTSAIANPFGNSGFECYPAFSLVHPGVLVPGLRIAMRACIISSLSGQRTPWRKATVLVE